MGSILNCFKNTVEKTPLSIRVPVMVFGRVDKEVTEQFKLGWILEKSYRNSRQYFNGKNPKLHKTVIDIGDPTQTWQVGASTNDASGRGAYPNATVIFLDFFDDYIGNTSGTSCWRADRFLNVGIPKGSTIVSAKITFYSNVALSGIVCNLRIYGEASDNASTFSTVANYNARVRTTAYVNWSAIPAWGAGVWYDSPNISTIIQEIINRSGWVSGNALVIYTDDNGSSWSAYREPALWDLSPNGKGCKLTITWTTIVSPTVNTQDATNVERY